jgi:hypothetical protein
MEPGLGCRTPVSQRFAEKSRNRQWGLKLHDGLRLSLPALWENGRLFGLSLKGNR